MIDKLTAIAMYWHRIYVGTNVQRQELKGYSAKKKNQKTNKNTSFLSQEIEKRLRMQGL